ncbi:hypothetical protein [Acinetobacter sp.]|jgi:hypothetical protein|uniref:hypothetical protein n=1 Tax=Acinetobacter sp. TaxID=472 RepID=UPI002828193C|nr:hypothetical protein [Acinetobacter sp.]MDR2250670.1 hypothetical protein [Acinetobacter sp.]
MTLPKSESGDTGLTQPKKEMTEQNDDALIDTPLPNRDNKKPMLNLNRQRKPTAQIAKRTTKNVSIPLAAHNPNCTPMNETATDKENLDQKEYHDYEQ